MIDNFFCSQCTVLWMILRYRFWITACISISLWASLFVSPGLILALSGQTQTAPSPPLRLGGRARGLSEEEISSLHLALPQGQKAWLLYGIYCEVCLPAITAYLPPTKETAEIRRGSTITLRPPTGASQSWTVIRADGAYAQVVVPGRAFDLIQSDEDINQPFTVRGSFDDAELVSLVSFARSYSGNPLRGVSQDTSGEVRIAIRETATASTLLTLGKQGGRWVILRVVTAEA